MKFNMNDNVKIKITEHGRELLSNGSFEHLYKEDDNGWSKWQLWHVMEIFGPHISLGCTPPFETEIEIL